MRWDPECMRVVQRLIRNQSIRNPTMQWSPLHRQPLGDVYFITRLCRGLYGYILNLFSVLYVIRAI